MSYPTRLPDRSDEHTDMLIVSDAAPQVAAPFAEAANDDDFYRNPLWLVVGAMAVLFTVLACLVASG
jgi:hypothetical protein